MDLEYQQLNDSNGWVDFYKSIVHSSNEHQFKHKCTQARLPSNLRKNRYANVLPFDDTRVQLEGDGDYINASFVSVPDSSRTYILTQVAVLLNEGPLDRTVESFWEMVWQQNSRGIIMLNRLTENGAVKCCQYWPLSKFQTLLLNNGFQVTLVEQIQQDEDCIIRRFDLANNNNDESRTICQFHYTSWPDFGVPLSPFSFYKFVDRIQNFDCCSGDYGPHIIHCSAGIGRSGTYSLVDFCLLQIEKNRDLSLKPMEILLNMRKCRKGLVQTPEQLRFAYRVILCGAVLLLGQDKVSCNVDFDISVDNLKRKASKLTTNSPPPKPKRSKIPIESDSVDSTNGTISTTSQEDQLDNNKSKDHLRTVEERANEHCKDVTSRSLRHRSYKEKQEKTAALIAEIRKNITRHERRNNIIHYLLRIGLPVTAFVVISIVIYNHFS